MKYKLSVVAMTLLLMVLLTACGNIKMKKSSDEYSGSNYESVSEELKQMGFSNITLEEIEDLTSSGPMKDGDVESVSINGETSFASNASFSKESEVVITYHTIKKLALPIGSDSISGVDYTELADVFTKAGFENIQTNEIYDLDPDTQEKDHIVDVIVNNNDIFNKDDKVPYDAEIIINCHLFYEKYTLTLNIDFIPNIIFDRYDVNLTVGDNKVATIEHGEDWQGEISLKSNKYKLSFTNVEDSSVKGTAEIDLDCDIEAEYKIYCHSEEIDVEEQYVDRKANLGENQTKVTCTENNYLYKDHQEVYDELKSLGFTNIVEKPVYDIVWGVTEEGSVAGVSINGSTEYRRGDVFDKNVEVIITYHMNEEDDPAYIEQQKKEAEEAAQAEEDEEEQEETNNSETEVEEEETVEDTLPEILTVDNCEDLADLFSGPEDYDKAANFAGKYRNRTIEFNGSVYLIEHHGSAKTRYDIMVCAGDFDENSQIGPTFKFEDVNANDVGENFYVILDHKYPVGTNVYIKAVVEEFNSETGIFFLDPVSMTER